MSPQHYLLALITLPSIFICLRVLQQSSASPPCNYTSQLCGNLSIPYPFGMSTECGLSAYRIVCKRNATFLQIGTSKTKELQVLEFSTNTLIVNSTHLKAMPSSQFCTSLVFGDAALELFEGGPFIMSDNNWFVVVGCNSQGTCTAYTDGNENSTISCTNSCYNQDDIPFCNSYACCINPIPPRSWRLDFQGRGLAYKMFPGLCGFSTVLSPSTYRLPVNERGFFAAGHYGLSLTWALQLLEDDQNCSTAKGREDYACSDMAKCIDGDSIHGYTCNCTQGYRGDGYKSGIGCQGVLGGIIFLAVLLAFFWTSRRAYMKRRERHENFQRIGGNHLDSFLFSERDLLKATNGFSSNHVIGEGGFGKVYWGKLSTKHGTVKVAIKRAKPKAVEEQVAQMQSFVKEIILLRETVHKNVVRLMGCCVETSVPLLVYEFVEKGTLRDYLKPQGRGASLILQGGKGYNSLWAWRIHIAVETAEALSYLHNKSESIFHLDMKSANILID